MATELTQIFRDALELSDNERATLVGLLIESLEATDDVDLDVEAAWAAEAERRWHEIESGAVKTIPWEEVRAKLFRGECPKLNSTPRRKRNSRMPAIGIENAATLRRGPLSTRLSTH